MRQLDVIMQSMLGELVLWSICHMPSATTDQYNCLARWHFLANVGQKVSLELL